MKTPVHEVVPAEGDGGDQHGDQEAGRGGGRQPAAPGRRGGRGAPVQTSHASGSSVTAAVCFVSVDTAIATPEARGRSRPASTNAATIVGSMKTSKLAACTSWAKKTAVEPMKSSPTMTPARPLSEAPPGLGGQEQGGGDVGQDGQHPDGREVVRARDPERRREQVGHDRRLAVDRLVVQPSAPVDHLGLGREVGLVGVEDLLREAGGVDHEGHDHEEDAVPTTAGQRRGPTGAGPSSAGTISEVTGGTSAGNAATAPNRRVSG